MGNEKKLQEAKQLIQQKQYEQARKILRGMPSDPTAQKWRAKLDQIAPPEKKTRSISTLIIAALIGLLVLILGGFAISSMLGEEAKNTPEPESVVVLATATNTFTATVAPENTAEASPTFLSTNLPTNTLTPTDSPENTIEPSSTSVPVNTLAPTATPENTAEPVTLFFEIETPADNDRFPTANVDVQGWAVDTGGGRENGPGIDLVRVYQGEGCEGTLLAETTALTARPDVMEVLDLDESYLNSGFQLPLTSVLPGTNLLTICARSVPTGNLSVIGSRTVHISEVRGKVESPAEGVSIALPFTPFEIGGWVIPLAPEAGTGPGIDLVGVYPGAGCEGTALAETTALIERPDVVDVFDLDESYLNTGFQLPIPYLPPGTNTLAICARSVLTGKLSVVEVLTIHVRVPGS